MVVEIETPKLSCRSALDYNQKKVVCQVAEIVSSANLLSEDREGIYRTFELFSHGLYDVRQVSFHASVNPAPDDECTQEQVISFIHALMAHLGYSQQPYVIYKHMDIDREHYHVVSSRINAQGLKIKNLYEKKKTTTFMREHAQEYGFRMADNRSAVKSQKDISKDKRVRPMRFNPSGPVLSQLQSIYSNALQYDYKGFQQFACILEYMGVRAQLDNHQAKEVITLQALDTKGRAVATPLTEQDMQMELAQLMKSHSGAKAGLTRKRSANKERLKNIVLYAFQHSKSESHFENMLKNKGISLHRSVSESTGEVFGLTFVDHCTKSVFKASELSGVISVSQMRDAVNSGRWRAQDKGDGGYRRYAKQARQTVRKAKDAPSSDKLGALAEALKSMGQPHGNSWSGRSKKSELERESERNARTSGVSVK